MVTASILETALQQGLLQEVMESRARGPDVTAMLQEHIPGLVEVNSVWLRNGCQLTFLWLGEGHMVLYYGRGGQDILIEGTEQNDESIGIDRFYRTYNGIVETDPRQLFAEIEAGANSLPVLPGWPWEDFNRTYESNLRWADVEAVTDFLETAYQ